jgi:hypothetical protein
MKSFFFSLLLFAYVVQSSSAQPYTATNAPISSIFYEFFEPYTNASPSYVIPPSVNSPDHLILIVQRPLDRVNEIGTHADFTVVATYKGPPLTYQWYKLSGITNRVAIPGATENVLCIEGVQSSDVAGYEVVLSQGGQEKTNLLANLSVIRIACTASVLGEIQSPITAFTSGSGVTCDGVTFAKVYSPWDKGHPVLLYGPNVPDIYQIGTGINPTHMPKVTASTHNPTNDFANVPANTAIRLQNSAQTLGLTAQIYDQCIDNIRANGWPGDPNAARLFVNPMNTSNNRLLSTYRVTIYYNGNPPPSGVIYWNWRYHNDTTP